ncbi:MAG: AbrB/MazE/SpoVT family DNA-binding domain-containing protein [Acidobacteria bacterium]|nr:AbrB/MazE/SpoVT family DNA-binding domain-containing protein [Acidobacteriota bacterium]
MRKNLVAIGNSLGIIIEKPILDLLKIERDTPLEVRTDGERLIIERLGEEEREARLDAAIDRVMKNHHETLHKLAQ